MHPVRTFLDPLRPLRTGSVTDETATELELVIGGASEWLSELADDSDVISPTSAAASPARRLLMAAGDYLACRLL